MTKRIVRKFTDQENKFIIKWCSAEKYSIKRLAEKLGRDYGTIVVKVKKLGQEYNIDAMTMQRNKTSAHNHHRFLKNRAHLSRGSYKLILSQYPEYLTGTSVRFVLGITRQRLEQIKDRFTKMYPRLTDRTTLRDTNIHAKHLLYSKASIAEYINNMKDKVKQHKCVLRYDIEVHK